MDHQVRTARFDATHSAVAVPVLRYLSRRAQPGAVDDLYVEVLFTLWRRIDAVPDGGEIPWAIGVARRVLANHRRANGRAARLLVAASVPMAIEDTPFDADSLADEYSFKVTPRKSSKTLATIADDLRAAGAKNGEIVLLLDGGRSCAVLATRR